MTNEDNFILVSLNDEKSKSIAEVIGSKTCKTIINYLAEIKEASQKDLSTALKIPLNTIEYNIKKLLDSGFIQKTKNFFWSKKGKKIIMYKLSKKSIIISHKKSSINKFKSILPAFIFGISVTFAIGVYEKLNNTSNELIARNPELVSKSLDAFAESQSVNLFENPMGLPIWVWFLLGFLIAITIISIVNWRKL
jgi:predicted transcriptional regulator